MAAVTTVERAAADRSPVPLTRVRDPNARPVWLSAGLVVGVAFFTLFSGVQYLVMLSTAVKSNQELSQVAHWIPSGIDWTAVSSALTDPNLWTYLRNSFVIAIGNTLVVMLAGVPAAYTIARHEFR